VAGSVGGSQSLPGEGCALIGARRRDARHLQRGRYDLAGSSRCVEKDKLLTGARITPGDVLLGLPSNGLHTNGYSLARSCCSKSRPQREELRPNWIARGEELLKVHRSYLRPFRAERLNLCSARAYYGRGITGNTRAFCRRLAAEIQLGSCRAADL